ncbi:hypothetical protein RR42_m2041 [Cupriavidus basilensis]|uniref:Uncharacterized protein n=1 Tax=Cupriavidus basilensis TaxID=68895 RepID=A0A0C4Y8Z8_9BURK|nr:hypothetical protein RR42_m2041 [Cupriavidus basilensis]
MISYINRYVPVRLPPCMEIEFIPNEWTVNTQGRSCQRTD